MHRPLVIAHRGLVSGGTENSLGGTLRAVAAGADMIELDIRLSLDRQPVVVHDWWLGRTTLRPYGWVDVIPSALLTRMRLRSMTGGDERIPLLRTILSRWPQGVELALHLKDRWALRSVLRLIQDYGLPNSTWLWLGHTADIHKATRALPDVRCTLLRPGAQSDAARERYFVEAQLAGACGVSIPWGAVSRDIVRLAHQHNLKVFSLARDDVPFAPAIQAGLDGVITDDPAAIRDRLDAITIAPK